MNIDKNDETDETDTETEDEQEMATVMVVPKKSRIDRVARRLGWHRPLQFVVVVHFARGGRRLARMHIDRTSMALAATARATLEAAGVPYTVDEVTVDADWNYTLSLPRVTG